MREPTGTVCRNHGIRHPFEYLFGREAYTILLHRYLDGGARGAIYLSPPQQHTLLVQGNLATT